MKYAYIVRSLAGKASRIYRVDLDGKETQVRFGDVSGLTLINLKRMLNISSKENVSNYILNGQLLSFSSFNQRALHLFRFRSFLHFNMNGTRSRGKHSISTGQQETRTTR